VAELALDQRQRDPLVQQLNCVGVAQLVRRHPPTDPCLDREVLELGPRGAG
jgi:hypothetical protein